MHVPAVREISWPLSYFAQLGDSSTLGAIQAMELLLILYENICRSLTQSPPVQEKKSARSRIISLRELADKVPALLSTEVLQVLAIIDKAVPARNRLVHGETKEGDEEMVTQAHSLVLLQAALARRIRWSDTNPVYGEMQDISFDASLFCTVSDGVHVMRLGEAELRSSMIERE